MEDYSLGFLLTKSARLIQKQYEEKLQKHGMTPQQSGVLSIIGAHDGISPAEIVPKMHSDKATVSSMLNRLEKLGLIEFHKSQTDGRQRILRLSSDGKTLLPEIHRIDAEISRGMAKGLSNKERAVVHNFLFSLYKST